MSNRSRTVDVSMYAQNPSAQVHVDKRMDQIMDLTVNAGIVPNNSAAGFLPEASITMPYTGSVAALTVKAYGQGVSGGTFAIMPVIKSVTGSGATFVSGSIFGLKKYAKSQYSFNEKDALQLCYSASSDYFGPSGSSAGFRIGLWVWQ